MTVVTALILDPVVVIWVRMVELKLRRVFLWFDETLNSRLKTMALAKPKNSIDELAVYGYLRTQQHNYIPTDIKHLCLCFYNISDYFTKHADRITINASKNIAKCKRRSRARTINLVYGNEIIDLDDTRIKAYKWTFQVNLPSIFFYPDALFIGICSTKARENMNVNHEGPLPKDTAVFNLISEGVDKLRNADKIELILTLKKSDNVYKKRNHTLSEGTYVTKEKADVHRLVLCVNGKILRHMQIVNSIDLTYVLMVIINRQDYMIELLDYQRYSQQYKIQGADGYYRMSRDEWKLKSEYEHQQLMVLVVIWLFCIVACLLVPAACSRFMRNF